MFIPNLLGFPDISMGMGGNPFIPTDVPDLVAWYDGADAASVQQVGGSVSQWNDKSTGSPYNLTQATGANQPMFVAGAVGGRSALMFDGADDFLSSTVFATSVIASGPNTVVIVIQPNTIKTALMLSGASGANTTWGVRQAGTGNTQYGFQNGPVVYATGAAVGKTSIVLGRRSEINQSVKLDDAVEVTATTAADASVNNGLIVGRAANASGVFAGYICEILAFKRSLTNDEANALGNYLAQKWGVTWTNV